MYFYKLVKNLFALILMVFVLCMPLIALDTNDQIEFTEGLVLKYPFRGWSSSMSDPVEKSMILGTWKTPQAGDQVVIGDTTISWETIKAGDDGWISDRSVRRGYVSFSINAEQDRIMLLENNGNDFVYVNSHLRIGNRYGYKENFEPWEPNFNFSILPVALKRGSNDFLFRNTRTGRLKASLKTPDSDVMMNIKDATLPDFLIAEEVDTWGAVVLINATEEPLKSFELEAKLDDHTPVRTEIPVIQPLSVRKVGFRMHGKAAAEPGEMKMHLKVLDKNETTYDSEVIQIQVKNPEESHKRTFISEIDGSVQYYAINPAQDDPEEPKALVLSVHGAAVEAINQAASYYGKTWAHIVAPTNRRPYGFNWEDWGRLDALEVMGVVKQKLNIDPDRIYLTGHSMGGHGTWHLGATFPDKFAAIGPSAGWISFWSYRVRDEQEERTPLQNMLMRPTMPSHTFALAENYKQHGVYIIHGADDDNVKAEQARMMVEHLKPFHHDFIYHEQPGQGHWWDISDEPGSDCVDWPPLFDFFARHARPQKERIRTIEFITASPGISSKNNWLSIEAQQEQLKLSKINIRLDPGLRRLSGTTENVSRISFDLSMLEGTDPITFELDSQKVETVAFPAEEARVWLQKEEGQWKLSKKPSLSVKGPHRYGTFKDAFKNRFMLVYGTGGNAQENEWALAKAKYDAEHFWYQGNGSVDVIPDTDFNPESEPDRNVILYGNAQTNGAWKALLADSPVQVLPEKITIGDKEMKGGKLGCLFIRPRPGSTIASVGAVSGTGIIGMRISDRRRYLSPGFGYPDVIVFTPDVVSDQEKGVKMAGFFGLDWSLEHGEFVYRQDD